MESDSKHLNNLFSIIALGQTKLLKANISNAKKEIEWFLKDKFSITLHDVIINKELQLTDNQIKIFNKFIERRIHGEPFQYILKEATFYGYDFIVNKHTLIPRPETETIISVAKKYAPFNDALDIGTGSGNLAITLLLENIVHHIDAIDKSKEALKIAIQNKKKHNTLGVNFFYNDIFNQRPPKKYDLIISNPPYISKNEYCKLDKHIKNYEPRTALTDNYDGLNFYKFFSKNLDYILNSNGKIIIEIGLEETQQKIQKLFVENHYKYKWHKDLNGNYRVIELYK